VKAMVKSAIYLGSLRHRRFYPKVHEFIYSSTMFYLDLDELPRLFEGVKGWSLNKPNLGSFRREDYLGDPKIPLKLAVQNEVMKHLGHCPNGPVRMLTNLRILGFCFNPVTFYYVFESGADKPSIILAQVNNTPWNERHTYIIQCDLKNGKTTDVFDKKFHVSPFNPIEMHYRWVSTVPDEHLLVHMENHAPIDDLESATKDSQLHMDATLILERKEWSASLLKKLLWTEPWAAVKVPIAIYWQALCLWVKGVPYYPHFSSTKIIDTQLKTTGNNE
jgi:uncharacterized protein